MWGSSANWRLTCSLQLGLRRGSLRPQTSWRTNCQDCVWRSSSYGHRRRSPEWHGRGRTPSSRPASLQALLPSPSQHSSASRSWRKVLCVLCEHLTDTPCRSKRGPCMPSTTLVSRAFRKKNKQPPSRSCRDPVGRPDPWECRDGALADDRVRDNWSACSIRNMPKTDAITSSTNIAKPTVQPRRE